MKFDAIWTNAQLETMEGPVVREAAIGVSGEKIGWIGKVSDLPPDALTDTPSVTDCNGAWILPGLIDCHTHLVFAGNRADEFAARLNGASYEQIARNGGGILKTVAATRAADDETLFRLAKARAERLIAEGVTTLEVKSGYGLGLESEAKMLRVARWLGQELPLTVKTSFLGAHSLPPEFADNRTGYISLICEQMLPALADEGLVDAVDAFCETIGFSVFEVEQIFQAADKLGLPVKLHAEQLSDSGGCSLAAKYSALSVDHLEYLSTEGADRIAEAGTVAVLLPGAFYTLRETKTPPVELLRARGVPIAIASDMNPGSSPVCSLQLMLHMACTFFGLTVAEALRGVTVNAAQALGMENEAGSLTVGKRADFAVFDVETPNELAYWVGGVKPISVVRSGKTLSP